MKAQLLLSQAANGLWICCKVATFSESSLTTRRTAAATTQTVPRNHLPACFTLKRFPWQYSDLIPWKPMPHIFRRRETVTEGQSRYILPAGNYRMTAHLLLHHLFCPRIWWRNQKAFSPCSSKCSPKISCPSLPDESVPIVIARSISLYFQIDLPSRKSHHPLFLRTTNKLLWSSLHKT